MRNRLGIGAATFSPLLCIGAATFSPLGLKATDIRVLLPFPQIFSNVSYVTALSLPERGEAQAKQLLYYYRR
jgi:hypothetical protein